MVLLGKRIKELRNKYKLTQTELARMVGVTTATITAYECDSRQPSYEVLIRLAYTFNVTIDSILLERNESIIDVSMLNLEQINKVHHFIEYLKISDLIEVINSEETLDTNTYMNLKEKYPQIFLDDKYELIRKLIKLNKKEAANRTE